MFFFWLVAAANVPWNHQIACAEEPSPWQELGLQAGTKISHYLPPGCQIPSPARAKQHQWDIRWLHAVRLCPVLQATLGHFIRSQATQKNILTTTNNSFPSDFKREEEDYYPEPPKTSIRWWKLKKKKNKKKMKKKKKKTKKFKIFSYVCRPVWRSPHRCPLWPSLGSRP